MVQLAPHLVYPTPFLVPDVRRRPPEPPLGIGLNLYDVMATTRVGAGPARAGGAGSAPATTGPLTAIARSTATRSIDLVPALARSRPDGGLPLLRLPDRRRPPGAHRPRRGGAVRRGLRSTGARSAAFGPRTAGRAASHCADARLGRASSRSRADATSSTRPASGPTASAPRRSTTRPRSRASRPAAARTSRSTRRALPIGRAACIVPAGDGPHDLRAPLVRAGARRHDRQRLRGRPRHVQPGDDDIDYLLDAVNAFFGPTSAATTSPARTPACGR